MPNFHALWSSTMLVATNGRFESAYYFLTAVTDFLCPNRETFRNVSGFTGLRAVMSLQLNVVMLWISDKTIHRNVGQISKFKVTGFERTSLLENFQPTSVLHGQYHFPHFNSPSTLQRHVLHYSLSASPPINFLETSMKDYYTFRCLVAYTKLWCTADWIKCLTKTIWMCSATDWLISLHIATAVLCFLECVNPTQKLDSCAGSRLYLLSCSCKNNKFSAQIEMSTTLGVRGSAVCGKNVYKVGSFCEL